MIKFKNVMVRIPTESMIHGISSGDYPGVIDFELAKKQHIKYIEDLKQCGVNVTIVPADNKFPDSCFIEDDAVMLVGDKNSQSGVCAIISNPGSNSRNKETIEVEKYIRNFFNKDNLNIFKIKNPGALDGGDVMMVGDTYYIGESSRTNVEGIKQFEDFASKFGKKTVLTQMDKGLHLKSGVNYLEISPKTGKPLLLLNSDFKNHPLFDIDKYSIIYISDDEKYSANCIWVNNTIIVPEGYPKTLKEIQDHGYKTIICDTSEFRKLDGGLSCLSLRF